MTLELERLAFVTQQLSHGWQIETPVIERTVLNGPYGRASVFEFILWNQRRCQVIAVPDGPDLQRFLAIHTLAMISV